MTSSGTRSGSAARNDACSSLLARARAGPAGLVAGADPRAVVAVEVLVEQDEFAPVRIVLQDRLPAVNRAVPVGVAQERAEEAGAELLGHLVQVALPAGSGRALDGEAVT